MICDYRLKVFYTVALKGSFTAAAKELGITQPAVSNHIFELEGAVGDALFSRSRRETVLTSKGRILFEYAEKILNLYRCAARELVPVKRDQRKHLTIAVVPEAAKCMLKPLVEYYSKIYPETDISILERSMEEATAMFNDGEADLAITDTPWKDSDSTVFASMTVNGSATPMLTYYIRCSHDPANRKTIDEFLRCCKTYK